MSDKLEEAISIIEAYFWDDQESEDSGKKLFKAFAKSHEDLFKNAHITDSTENKFEFTQAHQELQVIFEKKLEELLAKSNMTVDEFYTELKIRVDDGEQDIILFVDMLNSIVDFGSFIDMMSNFLNNYHI